MNFEIVTTLTDFPVRVRCAALGVSEQGYYAHCRRHKSPGAHTKRDAELSDAIAKANKVARGTYGSPRLQTALAAQGERTSRRRISRLKAALGLEAKVRRRFVITTNSDHDFPVAPNRLDRNFVAQTPNTIWVSDITYLWSAGHWLYLCTILDCFSGRIVGRKLSRSIDATLVSDTLRMAIKNRQPPPGCIFHSDRGSQYASREFRAVLQAHGFVQSMSRRANCWDNAVAESSFARLKAETGDSFQSDFEATSIVCEYIDVFYNFIRIHTRNNLSPARFELNQNFN